MALWCPSNPTWSAIDFSSILGKFDPELAANGGRPIVGSPVTVRSSVRCTTSNQAAGPAGGGAGGRGGGAGGAPGRHRRSPALTGAHPRVTAVATPGCGRTVRHAAVARRRAVGLPRRLRPRRRVAGPGAAPLVPWCLAGPCAVAACATGTTRRLRWRHVDRERVGARDEGPGPWCGIRWPGAVHEALGQR